MKIRKFLILIMFLVSGIVVYGNKPFRVGTTTANYLEIGLGSAGCAMGEAYVSVADDISSIYWNPAGLGYLDNNEVLFLYHPWIANTKIYFAGFAMPVQGIGIFALSSSGINFERTEVTTMEMQDGTGATYQANQYNVNLSYGKRIVNWFSFGGNIKYVSSNIWHLNANAIAADLGVLVRTNFFNFGGGRDNGMKIGMSISNYGTKMKYNGMDLLQPIDIAEDEEGNYGYVEGRFRTQGWELPLIFRLGVSINPINTDNQKLTIAADALHPNNNSESVNIGSQYELNIMGRGKFALRCGYHGIFLEDSQFGLTFGGGLVLKYLNNRSIEFNYSYKNIGILGTQNMYSIGIQF
jgi:hypothetical protein